MYFLTLNYYYEVVSKVQTRDPADSMLTLDSQANVNSKLHDAVHINFNVYLLGWFGSRT